MIGGVISRELSSVSAPRIPTPPTTAKAVSIILSSANISFNLSEIDFNLAGLCEVDASFSSSSASTNNRDFLSFNWNEGIELTLSWISPILSWVKAASWAKTFTEYSEKISAIPTKKPFLLLTMLIPFL